MPKLAKFVRDNADLEERFLVVGIDQSPADGVEQVRRIVETRAAETTLHTELLPLLLVHKGPSGMYQRFVPDGLGDMVLLDPHGDVVAGGEAALGGLDAELTVLRRRIAGHVDALSKAKTASEVESHLPALYAAGTSAADVAAARFVEGCPPALAQAAFSAMARAGRYDFALDALGQKDAKRRKAAIAALASNPSAATAGPLLEFAVRKDASPEESRLALDAAFVSAPDHPDLVAHVNAAAKRMDIPGRAWCMELLGRTRAPAAKERLLLALAEDLGRTVRVAAAAALVAFGGPDVRAALERAAADDKIDVVRAAARKALDDLDKKDPPPSK